MKTPTVMILGLIGLATVLAVIAVASTPSEAAFIETISVQEWVYDSEEIVMTFSLDPSAAGKTWDDLDGAGVCWMDQWPGEFPNHQFADGEVNASGPTKGRFIGHFIPPAGPIDPLYVMPWVILDGTHYTWEWSEVLVKATPEVKAGGMQGWNLAGFDHQVTWYIHNADAGDIEETAAYWDTVSHKDETMDNTTYAHSSQTFSGVLNNPFSTTIALPGEATVVYIRFHAVINGRDFSDPVERAISVIDLPELSVTMAPAASLVGRTVVVNWSIPTVAGSYVQNTSVYWDSVSHAEDIDKDNYAHRSEELPGDDSRSYEVELTVPAEEGTVYFVIHCSVKDRDWYTVEEHEIAVRVAPTVSLVSSPEVVFRGHEATITWTVADAVVGDVANTAVHWDTETHAGNVDVSFYPHASDLLTGEEDATYAVNITMPTDAGSVYFIVHAIVLGEDFYAPQEYYIELHVIPEITVDDLKDSAFVDSVMEIGWSVTGLATEEGYVATVHWDTASHSGDLDKSAYAFSSPQLQAEGTGHYEINITLPDEAGPVYIIVNIQMMMVDFPSGEQTIQALALPSFVNLSTKAKVETGDKAKVTFTIDGVDPADISSIEVLWDTESHDDPTEYPESVDVTVSPDGEYEVSLKAPGKKGDVHYRVHAVVDGNDVYSEEQTFKVVEPVESPGFGALLALAVICLTVLTAISRRHRM